MFCALAFVIWGCDSERVYEKNYDFKDRYWLIDDFPVFEFEIADTAKAYNLYCNIRSSVAYPYSRIFVNYVLSDTTHQTLKKEMVSSFLFDERTGEPIGNSGLGDIYDQKILLLKNFTFKNSGGYKMQFEQFMRTDTLQGILAVGLRVEAVPASIE